MSKPSGPGKPAKPRARFGHLIEGPRDDGSRVPAPSNDDAPALFQEDPPAPVREDPPRVPEGDQIAWPHPGGPMGYINAMAVATAEPSPDVKLPRPVRETVREVFRFSYQQGADRKDKRPNARERWHMNARKRVHQATTTRGLWRLCKWIAEPLDREREHFKQRRRDEPPHD